MTDLEALRRRIREIDASILSLWKQRDDAAREIGSVKARDGLPLQNFEVEKAVLEHALAAGARLGLPAERIRALVRLLIESALGVQERDRIRASKKTGRRAVVVGGGGLMGGWFARFLSEQGYEVFVRDPKESPFPPPPAGERFDVVVVATPPSTVSGILGEALALAKPQGLVVDIASVKGTSAKELRRLAGQHRVASLHPMFGPDAETLMGRNVVVLDCGNPDAVHDARALFASTAAQTRDLPIENHDRLMAEVLGLAHATSLLFNEALRAGPVPLAQLEPVASTTFRKQVDLSREVAKENPRLYYEIQTLNPENLAMLKRLETAAAKLRTIVETRDRLGFADLMHRADAYYQGVALRSR